MKSLTAEFLTHTLNNERSRWFLWTPCFLGLGIALYFILPSEPHWGVAIASLAFSLGSLLLTPRSTLGLVLSGIILWCGFGFFLAKTRTHIVATPVVTPVNKSYTIKGWVVDIKKLPDKQKDKRNRLLIHLHSMSDKNKKTLPPQKTPQQIRVTTLKQKQPIQIGDFIQIAAILRPPPPPVWPGGFDYARHLWFAKIGGMGFAISPAKKIKSDLSVPLSLKLKTYSAALRKQIADNIQNIIPGRYGALAIALITGDRSHIAEKDLEALRNSGLAHILAISGLHMAIMAGTIYWLIRFILTAFPTIALKTNVRTIAATFALVGAVYYLFISGAGISTQRAFIMTSVMLIAIILKRPAVTLRNIALAALVILLLRPESIIDVGFQMSFAAVIALVSIYETFSKARERKIREGQIVSPPSSLPIRYIGGIASTTAIAGIAVAPIAVYHFHQINQFSLLGNLLAMPFVGIVIMPVVLIYFLASPLGIESYPLKLMEQGLTILMKIADYVSNLPGAVLYVPQIPLFTLAAIIIGGLWLVIWTTRWRYLGFFSIAIGLVVIPFNRLPDIIADSQGRIIAIKDKHKKLAAPKERAGQYNLKKWMEIYGDSRSVKQVQNSRLFRCDKKGCIAKVGPHRVSFIKHPTAIDEDCRTADIIISRVKISGQCPKPKAVIDKTRLRQFGAHAVYLEHQNIRIDTVSAYRKQRPWSREHQN